MIVLMVALFILGYACIALEHPLKVDKSASALILCALLWTIYIFYAQNLIPTLDSMSVESAKSLFPSLDDFKRFVHEKYVDGGVPVHEQVCDRSANC